MAAIPEVRVLPDSDEKLAQRIGAGDEAAFEELYRRYSRPLAAFGARLLRDRAAGEDVAQTSLLNAYRSMRRGPRPLHVRPWLYRIARNAAFEAQRRGHREIVDGDLVDTPARSDDSGFDREAWYEGLRALPRRQREAYLLRELNGLSVLEVAERLDLTRAQVEQALFAARNKLAERLAFGERISCEALQAAARGGTLPSVGRRAVKAHVRTCPSCRRNLPTPIGLFGNLGFALRQLLQWLTSGGAAPVAAKVGAVAVTAGLTAFASPHAYRALASITGLRTHEAARATAPVSPAPDPTTPAAAQPPVFGPPGSLVARLVAPPAATAPALAPPTSAPPDLSSTGASATDTAADPATTDPTSADEATTDPATSDASATATDPSPTDTSTDPTVADPNATDTATDPTATDTSTDPTVTDSTATDPSATDPNAPADPTTNPPPGG